jgi:hypothetical protein
MLRPLALLLPALIPSWRFFDVIAPSPRIEFAMLASPDSVAAWQAFRPRPARVALSAMLGRLFWNPRWYESLFRVSCAERLVDQPTQHSQDEIFRRIASDLRGSLQGDPEAAPWLTFRLVFLERQGVEIVGHEQFRAAPRRWADIAVR